VPPPRSAPRAWPLGAHDPCRCPPRRRRREARQPDLGDDAAAAHPAGGALTSQRVRLVRLTRSPAARLRARRPGGHARRHARDALRHRGDHVRRVRRNTGGAERARAGGAAAAGARALARTGSRTVTAAPRPPNLALRTLVSVRATIALAVIVAAAALAGVAGGAPVPRAPRRV